ncbi:putative invertase inhibitor [Prosopis cineraria]|uniref:putative invertase inhibitor n=1 Tax=Prosopis cineraria TaxID=364024 RepID=UPI00240F808E|nr:putative invertase inhibitor [Prosopis cineraria]
MKPSSLFSFSLILILSLSSFSSITANNNHVDLIAQTCKNLSKTDPNISYRFCRTSLQSDPHSRCVRNLRELGFISLKLLRHNVTETRVHIKNLLKTATMKKKKVDPFIKECLDDCFEVYSDAISSLRDAIKDYKAKLYADCNVKVSSVLDASTTCEDGFKEKDGVVSPLTKRNGDTFQLSAIALFIINPLNK